MIEEYNLTSNKLISRVWKKQTKLSSFEIPETGQLDNISKPNDLIQLSSSNVKQFICLIKANFIQRR